MASIRKVTCLRPSLCIVERVTFINIYKPFYYFHKSTPITAFKNLILNIFLQYNVCCVYDSKDVFCALCGIMMMELHVTAVIPTSTHCCVNFMLKYYCVSFVLYDSSVFPCVFRWLQFWTMKSVTFHHLWLLTVVILMNMKQGMCRSVCIACLCYFLPSPRDYVTSDVHPFVCLWSRFYEKFTNYFHNTL